MIIGVACDKKDDIREKEVGMKFEDRDEFELLWDGPNRVFSISKIKNPNESYTFKDIKFEGEKPTDELYFMIGF